MKTGKTMTCLLLAALMVLGAPKPKAAMGEAPAASSAAPAATLRPDQIPSPSEAFSRGSADLALDMLRQLRKEAEGENMVFSPLGVQMMLGMLNGAADDTTHQAINKAWGYSANTPSTELDAQLQNKIKRLQAFGAYAPKGSRFDVASAVFIKRGYGVSEGFGTAMEGYQSQVAEVDFGDAKTVADINRWASEKTNGRIPSMVEKFENPQRTRMVLVNAVNLEARWENEFRTDRTRRQAFDGSGGKAQVDMMRGGLEYGRYYQDKDVEFTTRSLLGGCDFFVLLPKGRGAGALDKAIASLDGAALETMLEGSDTNKVKYEGTLTLPRFSVAYSAADLAGTLQSLGLDLRAKGANFDKAASTPGQYPLILTSMLQKAQIDVNEEGVSASAVTLGEMAVGEGLENRRIVKVEMVVNRPFVYGILDGDGGLVFLGAVENLPAAGKSK